MRAVTWSVYLVNLAGDLMGAVELVTWAIILTCSKGVLLLFLLPTNIFLCRSLPRCSPHRNLHLSWGKGKTTPLPRGSGRSAIPRNKSSGVHSCFIGLSRNVQAGWDAWILSSGVTSLHASDPVACCHHWLSALLAGIYHNVVVVSHFFFLCFCCPTRCFCAGSVLRCLCVANSHPPSLCHFA